jgi:hypothetical protein
MEHAAWWWSWLLMVTGVTGLYFSGRRMWWGWVIGLFSELIWIIYGLVTKQYGFIVFALVYGFVFAKNAYSWYKNPITDNE